MSLTSKPFRKSFSPSLLYYNFILSDYHDNTAKIQQLSSSLKIDPAIHPQTVMNSRIKSTSESPFPRKMHKNSLKPRLTQQSSSKDLEKKLTESALRPSRTNSQKARNSSSLSPSTQQVFVKDVTKFLNPIEEILPKGILALKKKKLVQKQKPKIPLKLSAAEKLDNGLMFIAKNMKIVEDKNRTKENLKKKEPVFMSQTQTIFKVLHNFYFFSIIFHNFQYFFFLFLKSLKYFIKFFLEVCVRRRK